MKSVGAYEKKISDHSYTFIHVKNVDKSKWVFCLKNTIWLYNVENFIRKSKYFDDILLKYNLIWLIPKALYSTRMLSLSIVKFIYSEKATNVCEISTVDLSYVVTVKSTVEISQNFVAFSEYMNFTKNCSDLSLLV